jgi:hypothetical protein
VDASGNPIALQRIKGTPEYTVTEDDGSVQMEISGTEKLSIDSKEYHCTLHVELPKDLPPYFLDVGDITCS